MNRRAFLRAVGAAAIAIPLAPLAAKAIEATYTPRYVWGQIQVTDKMPGVPTAAFVRALQREVDALFADMTREMMMQVMLYGGVPGPMKWVRRDGQVWQRVRGGRWRRATARWYTCAPETDGALAVAAARV